MKEFTKNALELFNLKLTSNQLEAFRVYEGELLDWNQRFNLTAIRAPNQVRTKHFLDSLSCMCATGDLENARVIDIGTGAGFPGLPLKIINPSMGLSLVESVGKKVQFCQHIVTKLDLQQVEMLPMRAEIIGQMPEQRQSYDWALARAVANLPILVEYLLPLVRVGGSILAMKGESAPVEVHSAEYAIQLLGGRLRKLTPIILPGVVEERYLVVIDKIAATPPSYPRRVGLPAKHPLSRNG